jgi:secreted trypsin-like serine protease
MFRPRPALLMLRNLLAAAILAGFTLEAARAQSAATFKLDLSSEGTVQAGKGQPDHKIVTGDAPISLGLGGGETDACFPGDGRPSAAQANGEKRIVMQSDDRVVVELSSRSYARGGHIRKCASCPVANTCLGISGEDTSATASAISDANLNIAINSPLKRFRYDLFVGHVDTQGQLSVSVTTADGKPLTEMRDRPSHFLITETNREVFVHARAATGATDKGGCCDSTDARKGIVTVSLEPAAEIDANFTFKPFIAGGRPTLGYPYVVALGLNGRITCSGTYVGGHSIVTAAHCVFPVKDSFHVHKLDVRFGSRFDKPDQIFDVDAVDIPDDPAAGFSFNPKTFEDDVALVTFAGDATAKPAALYAGDPSWSSIVGKKLPVEIVGFGFNVIDGGMVGLGYKREASIYIDRFENRKIFFGAQTANTCDGDSGGPMFVETPDGKSLLLAGVTSGGDDNCTYGVDMRLDAFAGWIKPHLK